MHGSRGIYHDGWKATTDYVSPLFGERRYLAGSHDFDDDRWALFNLADDFAEARDLADAEPRRLMALRELWRPRRERAVLALGQRAGVVPDPR